MRYWSMYRSVGIAYESKGSLGCVVSIAAQAHYLDHVQVVETYRQG